MKTTDSTIRTPKAHSAKPPRSTKKWIGVSSTAFRSGGGGVVVGGLKSGKRFSLQRSSVSQHSMF